MKMTRRTLLGSVAAVTAVAQTPVNYLSVSTDTNKRNADAIAQVPLPQSTEPAFSFKV